MCTDEQADEMIPHYSLRDDGEEVDAVDARDGAYRFEEVLHDGRVDIVAEIVALVGSLRKLPCVVVVVVPWIDSTARVTVLVNIVRVRIPFYCSSVVAVVD